MNQSSFIKFAALAAILLVGSQTASAGGDDARMKLHKYINSLQVYQTGLATIIAKGTKIDPSMNSQDELAVLRFANELYLAYGKPLRFIIRSFEERSELIRESEYKMNTLSHLVDGNDEFIRGTLESAMEQGSKHADRVSAMLQKYNALPTGSSESWSYLKKFGTSDLIQFERYAYESLIRV